MSSTSQSQEQETILNRLIFHSGQLKTLETTKVSSHNVLKHLLCRVKTGFYPLRQREGLRTSLKKSKLTLQECKPKLRQRKGHHWVTPGSSSVILPMMRQTFSVADRSGQTGSVDFKENFLLYPKGQRSN